MSTVEGSVKFTIDNQEVTSYLHQIFGADEYDISDASSDSDSRIVKELSEFNPKVEALFNSKNIDWVEPNLKDMAEDSLRYSKSGIIWKNDREYISQLFGELMGIEKVDDNVFSIYYEGGQPFIGSFLAELLRLLGAYNVVSEHDFFEAY
ncbi:hypothetical protein ACJJIL_16990 [Microbulbifer sp. EKSA005]|uniref:hypothetical protein n=1 Tax=Microbulbifer sp. EKSA005 TaxID=3243364 RepID=UPI0040425BBB